MNSLDKLRAVLARMTWADQPEKRWEYDEWENDPMDGCGSGQMFPFVASSMQGWEHDLVGIAALRNLAPQLLAVVEAAAEFDSALGNAFACPADNPCHQDCWDVMDECRKEYQQSRTALALAIENELKPREKDA